MTNEIKKRGKEEVFGRLFTVYDFPEIDFRYGASKNALIAAFPAAPPCELGTIPLYHFPSNRYDHFAYVVAKWHKPKTLPLALALFDQHSDAGMFYDAEMDRYVNTEWIDSGSWVAHLIYEKILANSVWFHGMAHLKYAETITDLYADPIGESSRNLTELVERNLPSEAFISHYDPDFLSAFCDIKLHEARKTISLTVRNPNLVAFSIGEQSDKFYRPTISQRLFPFI